MSSKQRAETVARVFNQDGEHVAEGQSVEGVRLCVIEKDGDGEIGECLLHLPDDKEVENP